LIPYSSMLADASTSALLASAPLSSMLTDASTAALFALPP
jgi:hypothetical protein